MTVQGIGFLAFAVVAGIMLGPLFGIAAFFLACLWASRQRRPDERITLVDLDLGDGYFQVVT